MYLLEGDYWEAQRDFKINFAGSFVYINNEGISEYTLNSYKEYISINLW